MKLKVPITGLVALLCALTFCTAPASAERVVKHGSHGATVRKLQRLLHVHADGVFGKGTVHALKRFQRRHHLPADGVAGPATWRMLKRAGRVAHHASSSARVMSRGPSVRLLQRKLGVAVD